MMFTEICDGEINCVDGTDEANCASCPPARNFSCHCNTGDESTASCRNESLWCYSTARKCFHQFTLCCTVYLLQIAN